MQMEALHKALLKKYPEHLVCGPKTDLVIEGYPRSSNSFTIWMLKVLQGEGPFLRIGHHTHSTDNLMLAAHFGCPAIVLIRKPEDAILSYMIYEDRSVEFATNRYTKFFTQVLALPVAPGVVEFETVITDFNQVVAKVNAATKATGGHKVPLSQDLAADTALVQDMARTRAAKIHGTKSDKQVGVPNAAREAIKATRRDEVQAYLAERPDVVDLYDKVLAHGA